MQHRMTEMLRVIDGICRRHGLRYWLCSGTLLGAVRHEGYIPWDDALDSACAAELVRVPALIGTALLDQSAPTEGTFALYNRLPGQKEMRVYPKYGHERINQFENEQINYLCEVISGLCHN